MTDIGDRMGDVDMTPARSSQAADNVQAENERVVQELLEEDSEQPPSL